MLFRHFESPLNSHNHTSFKCSVYSTAVQTQREQQQSRQRNICKLARARFPSHLTPTV